MTEIWNWAGIQRKSDSLMNKAYLKAAEKLVLKALKAQEGPENLDILDIGAGSGLILRYISENAENYNYNYTGLDLNLDGLKLLEERGKSLGVKDFQIINSGAEVEIEKFKDKFDLIFSNFCLYTINDCESRKKALLNLNSYLKDKGTFHIALPTELYSADLIYLDCIKQEFLDSNLDIFKKIIRGLGLTLYQRFFVLKPIEKGFDSNRFVRFSFGQIQQEFSAANLEIDEIQLAYGGAGYHIHGKKKQ